MATTRRKTLLPWMGGKSKLAKDIIQHFPEHTAYVEPFCGGCAVLWAKPRSKAEIINDADERLVNLLRVGKYHPEELTREMALSIHSRTEFRAALTRPGLTDIQRAGSFLMTLGSCFGAKVDGPTFGYSRQSPPRFHREWVSGAITAIRERLDRVTVEHLDFEGVLKRYDAEETLFYCDPPYIDTDGYAQAFDDADHERLRTALGRIKGMALVSLNDNPKTRRLYAGWEMIPLQTTYSIDGKRPVAAKELLIRKTA